MVLFDIPDIRLLWSEDKRFLEQFKSNQVTKFKSYSKFPACYKDITFWINDFENYSDNDFFEIVRNISGKIFYLN
jgi:phenylalanyl-tRNA synthetase alpha chain